VFESCDCDGTSFHSVRARDAQVRDCTFVKAALSVSHWQRSTFIRCDFSGAAMRDMELHDAIFVDCIFRDVDFRPEEAARKDRGALRARFERCDFRGAKVDGWRLDHTLFDRCAFHGVVGEPAVEGPLTFLAADLSPAADGSRLGPARYVGARWLPPVAS